MRRLSALAALGLLTMAPGVASSPAVTAPWQLERSDVLTIRSPDGHAYRVLVAWPEGEPPAGGWPLLWMLDGEDNFPIAATTARRLARAGARSGIGPGLIVAIDSGPLARRVFDYTPAAPDYAIPAGAPASGLPTGGADIFLRFIEQQARPQIVARWKIDASRQTLMGHSFGGLLALHALAKGAPFSRYVAVSPSFWFGNGLVAREVEAMAPAPGKRLLAASGDSEGGPTKGDSEGDRVAALFTTHGVEAQFRLLPGHSHGSTMMAMMTDGIATAFGTESK